MQLKYGLFYVFGVNENHIATGTTTRFNKGGQPYSQVRWIDIKGDLLGNGQAANIQLENGLKSALSVNFQDLIFYDDSGFLIAEALINSQSITGVQIVDGPNFKDTMGPQFATLRSYQFRAQAEFPIVGRPNYLNFTESLAFAGGGPLYGIRRALNGPPQRQQVWALTEYTVDQTGSAEGYLSYPPVPTAKFPFALKQAPQVRFMDPTRKGPAGWEAWPISWSYHHEWPSVLSGLPTLWNF
jgi:hypothetical protein